MSVNPTLKVESVKASSYEEGYWLGRIWAPESINFTGQSGPLPIFCQNGNAYLVELAPLIISEILEKDVLSYFSHDKKLLCTIKELLNNSLYHQKDLDKPYLLAPNDLQAIKACGVTFAGSLIERVIEEKADGDPQKAHDIRTEVKALIGEDLSNITPGSPESAQLRKKFKELGLWSQYLEVGIGPYAEVFTKSQIMSAIGYGSEAGLYPDSNWNNPEPEVVLAVNSQGEIKGATLGNDVNLRDIEGMSALLLGKAKDQNGTCVVGPFIRLFDDNFTIENVKAAEVEMIISGEDGFVEEAFSHMSEISRSPENLVSQVVNDCHQYPDGFMLFLGTMFAPVTDRNEKGMGFTHNYGDRVEIKAKGLGSLVNWMQPCDKIEPWTYGLNEFIKYLRNA